LFVCLFVRSITKKRMIPKCSNLVYGMVLGYTGKSDMVFEIQRSKVKITGSIALHNDTSFPTTIALYSHSLGGDTDKYLILIRRVFELYEYILVVR